MPTRIIQAFVMQCGHCRRFYSHTAPFVTDVAARATSFASALAATQQAEANGWILRTFGHHCPTCTHPTPPN